MSHLASSRKRGVNGSSVAGIGRPARGRPDGADVLADLLSKALTDPMPGRTSWPASRVQASGPKRSA